MLTKIFTQFPEDDENMYDDGLFIAHHLIETHNTPEDYANSAILVSKDKIKHVKNKDALIKQAKSVLDIYKDLYQYKNEKEILVTNISKIEDYDYDLYVKYITQYQKIIELINKRSNDLDKYVSRFFLFDHLSMRYYNPPGTNTLCYILNIIPMEKDSTISQLNHLINFYILDIRESTAISLEKDIKNELKKEE